MIPLRLRMRNFLAYRDQEVDLRDLHVAVLVGPNGAGKSTILEAMTWALWGEARSSSDDQLIRQGADDMIVEMAFKAQGQEYKVERRRLRGKRSHLLLFGPGGESLTGPSIASTESFIRALLRTDHETFVNTAFFAQGKADAFTQAQPAHRQEILASILGLERYQELSDVCRRRALDLTTELAAARGSEETLAAQASRLSDCRQRLAAAREEVVQAGEELRVATDAHSSLSQQLAQATARTAELAAARSQFDVYRQHAERLERELGVKGVALATLREQARTLPDLEAKLGQQEKVEAEIVWLQETTRDLPELKRQHGEAVGRWRAQVEAKVEQASQYTELGQRALHERDMPCPTCLQPLTRAAAATLLEQGKRLRAEAESERFPETELQERLTAKETAAVSLQDLQRQAGRLPELRVQARSAREATSAVPDLEAELDELRRDLEAATASVAEARGRIEAMGEVEKERRGLEQALLGAEAKRKVCDEAYTAARSRMAALETEVNLAEEAERQLQELRRRVAVQTQERDDYQELGEAFGKRGVQALLVDRALPEVEAVANDILDRLWLGAGVELRTQREPKRKDGQVIETLDIVTTNENGELPYENCSGGQKFRVDFAIRLALARLLARRADAAMPLLVIDEGFGTQDAEGRKRLLEAIRGVQDDFELVLAVTHIEEMAESFQRVLVVAPGPDGPSVARR